MLEALCFKGSKEDPCDPWAKKEKGEVQKDKYNTFQKKQTAEVILTHSLQGCFAIWEELFVRFEKGLGKGL